MAEVANEIGDFLLAQRLEEAGRHERNLLPLQFLDRVAREGHGFRLVDERDGGRGLALHDAGDGAAVCGFGNRQQVVLADDGVRVDDVGQHVVEIRAVGAGQFGTEVLAQASIAGGGAAIRTARVGALDVPIPNSRIQEREVLPSRERIIEAILGLF